MHVFRPPFLYAQRAAARTEWQPQIDWFIECSVANLSITTYAATVETPTTINCNTAALVITGYSATVNASTSIACGFAALTVATFRATVTAYKIIECSVDNLSLTGQPSTVTGTLLTIPVKGISIKSSQSEISAKLAHNSIGARESRSVITARAA